MPHGQSPKHTRKARKKSAAKTIAAPKASTRKKSPSRGPSARVGSVGPVRLQKLLAGAGFGSRREVEQFMIEERVTVNGRVANLGDRADPSVDDIRLDGERLLREKPSYWIINKPRGVVTTVRDEEGRRTVIDLLPRNVGRLFPVGRLDKETSGLLLLTNDGDTAHAMLHPSLGNEREYKVNVKGEIDGRVSGVRFDSDSGTSSFSLVLVEGRKRQIRRSLLILGFPVRRLVRVRMGPLRLGRLAVGEARPLRADERRALLAHAARLRGNEERPRKPARKSASRRPQRTLSSRKGARK
jgi:23S rRNA pseudouridine2605 synthase